MKMMKFCVGLIVLLVSGNAYAGWYDVTNYVGKLGDDSVHLSLQHYDSFGSGITVEGSYYFDKHSVPVPLYGRSDSSGRLRLCEILDEKTFNEKLVVGTKLPVDMSNCSFTISSDGLSGTWARGKEEKQVELKKVGSFKDSAGGTIDGVMEIPFWLKTAKHFFIGVYAREADRICLEKIHAVNINTRQVDQSLDFENEDCSAGFLMTPIYMNLSKYIGSKGEELFAIQHRGGGYGYQQEFIYEKKIGKYVPTKKRS